MNHNSNWICWAISHNLHEQNFYNTHSNHQVVSHLTCFDKKLMHPFIAHQNKIVDILGFTARDKIDCVTRNTKRQGTTTLVEGLSKSLSKDHFCTHYFFQICRKYKQSRKCWNHKWSAEEPSLREHGAIIQFLLLVASYKVPAVSICRFLWLLTSPYRKYIESKFTYFPTT